VVSNEAEEPIMHTVHTAGDVRKPRRRRGTWTAVALVAGGLALAACSSNSASSSTTTSTASTTSTAASNGGTTATTAASGGGGSSLQSVLDGITRSSTASFSSTYTTTDGGKTQTVTFAQSPPKSAVITPEASFYISGTSVTECTGSGSTATCTSLPSSMASAADGLTALFSPGILTNTLKGIEAQAAAHTAGVSVTTSSASYGGYGSTCITAKTSSDPAGVTYCAARSNGILTYFSAAGNSGTLTAYTSNPPASTFSPPAGATVQTLPAGS
jgi:hypothetical protein